MLDYQRQVNDELKAWRRKMLKPSNMFNQLSKKAQNKMNELIPEKAHQIITDSIKNMVKATLAGSYITTKKPDIKEINLYRLDELAKEKLKSYRNTAVIEGAGTGAGGILLSLADFPLLLSIEMKFLFEIAAIYGFDTQEYEERLFILHVFQLAFSSDASRIETFHTVENWEREKAYIGDMDWYVLQQEYRDYIDLVKLLQFIPGLGSVFGAVANHNLLDTLGETAINAYRMRFLGAIMSNSPQNPLLPLPRLL